MERRKHATIATETLKVVGTAMLNKLPFKKTFVANNARPSNLKLPRCSLWKKSTKDYSTQKASELGEKKSDYPLKTWTRSPKTILGDTQLLLKTRTWISKISASNPSKHLAK